MRSIADMRGKKIRTVPSEILQKAVEAMGAQPTAIPGTELYLALQQGVADGAFTAPNFGLTMKYYEVTDAVTKLDLFYGGYIVLFHKPWFDAPARGATDADRGGPSPRRARSTRSFVQKDLAGIDEELRAVGQEVIELDEAALEEFRQALEPYYETLDPKIQAMIAKARSL